TATMPEWPPRRHFRSATRRPLLAPTARRQRSAHNARHTAPKLIYVFYTYMSLAIMSKKLTITVDEEVYAGLHRVIGRRRISRFLNDLARPHVLLQELEEGYRAMAADEEREQDAAEWVEGLPGDIADDPR